jgi:DnaJ-class molecular chaperone
MNGSEEEVQDCEYCKGLGGFDAARDCEVYDEWIECVHCGGTGRNDTVR